jgi:hypothetical protein
VGGCRQQHFATLRSTIPEAVKMEKHCMAIVKDAEKLAADAEWSEKYHRARAKELTR